MVDFSLAKPANMFDRIKNRLFVINDLNPGDDVNNLLHGHNRLYHGSWHVSQMFSIHEQLKKEWPGMTTKQYHNIVAAIYYHDAVYDTARKDNEYQSAELFRYHIQHMYDEGSEDWDIYSKNFWSFVYDLIMATSDHFGDRPYDAMTEWLIGLDLAALAAPWEMFKLNNSLVRLEFTHVSDEDWDKNRHWFLKKAIAQDKIYRHPVMHKHFEINARQNIERLIYDT